MMVKMKYTLKLLLLLCIVLAGMYAATPSWLPYILARQLPPGWQLEQLEAAYPGLTGIDIQRLRLKGELQMAGFTLAATDIRFNYKGLKTAIDSLSLDVRIRTAKSRSDDALTQDDLSLPVTKPNANLPELSVTQLRMAVHPGTPIKAGDIDSAQPLVVVFDALKLVPISNSSFHLVANANLEELPGITGQFELDVELMANRDGGKVSVTLPAPAKFKYQDQTAWIDQLLTNAVPGLQRTPGPQAKVFLELDQGSNFEFQNGASPSIRFNGDANFSLTSNGQSLKLMAVDFQVEMDDISDLESTTAGGLITLGWEENAPFAWSSSELDLKADKLSLSNTGKLRISHQAIGFEQTGDFKARLEMLQTKLPSGQSLESENFEMQGRMDFDISMSEPDALINFYFNGPVTATKPVIGLPGDERNPALTLTAADLSLTAEVHSQDETLVSTGNGVLMVGNITPPAISAERIDMTWQELDLFSLTGNLSTKTQGFAMEFKAETWTGFDFDVTYTLRSDADVSGSGTLKFESGQQWPIEFAGNTQAEHWDIKLPATTFELAQLRSLLQVAHFELPDAVKLTDGHIDLQGAIVADENVSASMIIKGYEMGASMHESNAHNASFLFNVSSDHTMSASGPVSIESIALAGGIDVANIRVDLNIEDMEIYGLQNLYAEVFGGQVRLLNLQFSKSRIEDSTIELSHINLGSLLEFADIDGLDGTGTLEISLPFGSDSTGVHINNGTFIATGPGHLAYTKEGVVSSNIGLQALENFQYQALSGTVDYQSDGAYRIAIRLEGKNPDLYDGHPIVFNLNIDGSLPELFEALFISGDFEESILNQIKGVPDLF